jgi:uncharacterized protein (DUF1778 family)
MSERGAGRLIGDAALSEVVTFRCTKSQKALLESARKLGGHASIGHFVRNTSLQQAAAVAALDLTMRTLGEEA